MNHLTTVALQHVTHHEGAYSLWAERAKKMYALAAPWWNDTRREIVVKGLAIELYECYAETNKPFPLSVHRDAATYTFDVPGALSFYWSLMDATLAAIDWRAIAKTFVYEFAPVDPIKRPLSVSKIMYIMRPYRRQGLAGWYKSVELQLFALLKEIAALPYTIGAASFAVMVLRTIPWAIDQTALSEENTIALASQDLELVLNGTIEPEWAEWA